jgi:hypothetical protein
MDNTLIISYIIYDYGHHLSDVKQNKTKVWNKIENRWCPIERPHMMYYNLTLYI